MSEDNKVKELTKSPFKTKNSYDKLYDKVVNIIGKHDKTKPSDLDEKIKEDLEDLLVKTKEPIEAHVLGNVLKDLSLDEYATMFFDKATELGYSNIKESLSFAEILEQKYEMMMGVSIFEDPNHIENVKIFANKLDGYDTNDVINTLYSLRDSKNVETTIDDSLVGTQLSYSFNDFSKDSGIITKIKDLDNDILITYDNGVSDVISKEEYNKLINNGNVNIKGVDVMVKTEELVENYDVETREEDTDTPENYDINIDTLVTDIKNIYDKFLDKIIFSVDKTVINNENALSYTFKTNGIDNAAYWGFRNEVENALDKAGIEYVSSDDVLDIIVKDATINEAGSINLELDIAEDLLPQVQKAKSEKGRFTTKDLEQIILTNGGNLEMLDNVVSELVNLGFEFDIEIEESSINENVLSVKFSNKQEFEKAKQFFDNTSSFNPDLINDEFMTFDFDVDGQDDMDSTENYIDEELREYFNSYSFMGESYERVNPKNKAREIRQTLKKEFPQIKFSITSNLHAITVTIVQAPINFLEGSERASRGHLQLNHHLIEDDFKNNEEAKEVLLRIKELIFDEQRELTYDGDYGSVPNYYGNIHIGKWDRPFVYTGSDNKNESFNIKTTFKEPAIGKFVKVLNDGKVGQIKEMNGNNITVEMGDGSMKKTTLNSVMVMEKTDKDMKDNENYTGDTVLTEEDAKKLYSLEEDNLAPGEASSDEDFKEFINTVSGMTLNEYTIWRWPDNPKEQYELAISVLNENNKINENMRPTTELEKKVFIYLNRLRSSGETNMFGATSYILNRFPELNRDEASKLLGLWMDNFNEDEYYDEINESSDNTMLVNHIRLYWAGLRTKDGHIGDFYVTPMVHSKIEDNFKSEISIDFIEDFVSVPVEDVSGYDDVINKMKQTEYGTILFKESNINEHHLGGSIKDISNVKIEDIAYSLDETDTTPYIIVGNDKISNLDGNYTISAVKGFDNFEELWEKFDDMNFGLSILAEDDEEVAPFLEKIHNILIGPIEIDPDTWRAQFKDLLNKFNSASKNVDEKTQHEFYKAFAPNILDILNDVTNDESTEFKYNDETDKDNSLYVYDESVAESVTEGFERRIYVNDVDGLRKRLLVHIIGVLWKGYITDIKSNELEKYIGGLAFDLISKDVETDGDAIENLAHELQLTPEFLADKLQSIISKYSYLFESKNSSIFENLETKEDKADYLAFHYNKDKNELNNMSEEVIDQLYNEYKSQTNENRSVKVTFSDGYTLTTAMAQHLTDEQIYDYYAIDKEFNLGRTDDDIQSVVDVEILESKNINESRQQEYKYKNIDAPWELYDSVEKPEKPEYNHTAVKNLVMQDSFLRYMYEEMMSGNYYDDMDMMYNDYIKDDEDLMEQLKHHEQYSMYQIRESVDKNEIGSQIKDFFTQFELDLDDETINDIFDILPRAEEMKKEHKQNYILLTNEAKENIKSTFENNIIDIVKSFRDTNTTLKDLKNDNILESLKGLNKDSLNEFRNVLEELKECFLNTTNEKRSYLGLITTCLILK